MAGTRKNDITRRGLLGTALVGVGAGGGWLVQRFRRGGGEEKRASAPAPAASNPWEYDLSAYENVDPALLIFEPQGQFETGFDHVGRLVAAPGDRLLVAGDRAVRVFDRSGELRTEVELTAAPRCLHVSAEADLFIGFEDRFDVYDLDGNRRHGTPSFGERTYLTSIATYGDSVYAADAGNREVIVCDREGRVQTRFGKIGDGANPGFAVPSPYFDLAVTPEGKLWIANPGRLRVEAYSLAGEFESSWGEAGMAIERLSGCCNPVYFAMAPDGRFITSEKGLARIKVYDAKGEFTGVVAGPSFLVDDKKLAKEACADCRIGAGFDVAVDERGWVHALDPFRKTVRSFRPRA